MVELTLRDAIHVAQRMRADDLREVTATRWSDDPLEMAMEAARLPGIRYCAVHLQHGPVAIGGVALHTPGVGTAWMVGTRDLRTCGLEITRHGKRVMAALLNDGGGLHRIECLSADFHHDAHEWLNAMGFTKEGVRRNYGKNGEDFYMFAKLRGR